METWRDINAPLDLPVGHCLGSGATWKNAEHRWKASQQSKSSHSLLGLGKQRSAGTETDLIIQPLSPSRYLPDLEDAWDVKLEPKLDRFRSLNLLLLRMQRLLRISVRRLEVHVLRAEGGQRGHRFHYPATQKGLSSISDWIKLIRTLLYLTEERRNTLF